MTTNIFNITTTPRVAKEKMKEGFIPAVYYGSHAKSTPIFVNTIEFTKVWKSAGESSSVVLQTEHGAENAMIHEVQFDPVKDLPRHIDFYIVEKGQKVHVKVPIIFIGEAPATKTDGVLVKVMHELPLEGEPTNIPHEITIDLSSLVSMDSVITVKDIPLPKGVELYHTEETEVIVAISAQKEEEEAPVAEVDLSAIEVEKKGKQEGESEEESKE